MDLAPTAPAGAKVASVRLKSNPGGAYGSYYDSSEQKLYVFLSDGTKVKPGKKATLTFSVTYEGQGTENNGAIKARDIKISATIGR
jgi:hypothetical protein